MKPEGRQRVYWTKVSINTKARIGHIRRLRRALYPASLHNLAIANTILQLQSQAFC